MLFPPRRAMSPETFMLNFVWLAPSAISILVWVYPDLRFARLRENSDSDDDESPR